MSKSDELCPWRLTNDEARVAELKRILSSVRRELLAASNQLQSINAEYEFLSKQVFDRSMHFLKLVTAILIYFYISIIINDQNHYILSRIIF